MVVTIIGRIIAIGADMRPSICRRDDRRRGRDGCESHYTLTAARRTPRCAVGGLRANWRLAVGVDERPSSGKNGRGDVH